MAGISDVRHELCLALALWNGRDPILKERMFGLTGPQGNHGEDVKEYWWYLEGLPSHALLRWRYHYPQAAFPYEQLVDHRRGLQDPELELLDTGVFDDDRYWAVDVTYAKASPTEILQRIVLTNHGADEATLHVLPTLWFRNTWSWGGAETRPRIERDGADLIVADHALAGYRLQAAPGPDGSLPEALFCENETNTARVFGTEALTPFPKDGINDHIVSGLPTVNPDGRGTKAAYHYAVTVAGGASAELRLRAPSPGGQGGPEEGAEELGRRPVRPGHDSPRGRRGRVLRRPRPARDDARGDAGAAPGERGPRVEQADVPLRRRTLARRRPGCRRAARRRASTVATAAGVTSTPSTCSRCPIRGSTRGSPRGTSASTRCPGHISTRRSRSTSSSSCSASGSCTRTARCPPTSGTSTT